jgi:hypothetical protein
LRWDSARVARAADRQRGHPGHRGHDRGHGGGGAGAVARRVPDGEAPRHGEPPGQRHEKTDQPRRRQDDAHHDEDRSRGHADLRALRTQHGQPEADQGDEQADDRPVPRAAHLPAAPAQRRDDVRARGLPSGDPRGDEPGQRPDGHDDQDVERCDLERPEGSRRPVLEHRHGDAHQPDPQQGPRDGRARPEEQARREDAAAQVGGSGAVGREQGQVPALTAEADREGGAGEQDDLQDQRDDDERDDSELGR